MGDPGRQRRKYSRPTHPWKAERITQEADIKKKYGLKNNKEIWIAKSAVGRFRQQARVLLGSTGHQAEKEKSDLIQKLNRLGIMKSTNLEDVLKLTIDDRLERRLQTLVYRKGLTRTIKEARQHIVHGHIAISDRAISVPGYIVPISEEDRINFKEGFTPKKPEEKVDKVERGEENREED